MDIIDLLAKSMNNGYLVIHSYLTESRDYLAGSTNVWVTQCEQNAIQIAATLFKDSYDSARNASVSILPVKDDKIGDNLINPDTIWHIIGNTLDRKELMNSNQFNIKIADNIDYGYKLPEPYYTEEGSDTCGPLTAKFAPNDHSGSCNVPCMYLAIAQMMYNDQILNDKEVDILCSKFKVDGLC